MPMIVQDIPIALALSGMLGLALSMMQLRDHAKTDDFYWRWPVFVFLLVKIVSYIATTILASTLFKKETVFGGPEWYPFWVAFAGVFAFEAMVKRLNVTFADTGVLSVQEWMNATLAGASAAMVRAEVISQKRFAIEASTMLASHKNLDNLVFQELGATTKQELETQANQHKLDPLFAKAYALALAKPDVVRAALKAKTPNKGGFFSFFRRAAGGSEAASLRAESQKEPAQQPRPAAELPPPHAIPPVVANVVATSVPEQQPQPTPEQPPLQK
jgi:hypothetical protein